MAFSLTPPGSPLPLISPGRYEKGYDTAQLLIWTGKAFMYWIGWIYGFYHVFAGPLFGATGYPRYGGSLKILVMQIVPALYQVAYTWAMGLLLVGIGHIVTAILDTADGSSPPPVEE